MKTSRYRKWRVYAHQGLALVIISGLILAVTARLLPAEPQDGYASSGPAISPEELEALLGKKTADIRIIDVRHKAKYYLGHIPGAVQVWRPQLEDKKASDISGSREKMEKLLSQVGVGPHTTLILYSDQYDQARLWWLLACYGFPLDRLKVLDGGIEAWKKKGFPTQLTSPRIKRTRFRLGGSPRPSLQCTLPEIKAALGDPQKVVLDIRSAKEYVGQESKEGRLPGAITLEWQKYLIPEGALKGSWQPTAEIRKFFTEQGITSEKDIYLFSHSCGRAAHALLTLYLVGYPLEKLHLIDGAGMEEKRGFESSATGPPSASATIITPAVAPSQAESLPK